MFGKVLCSAVIAWNTIMGVMLGKQYRKFYVKTFKPVGVRGTQLISFIGRKPLDTYKLVLELDI